MKNCMSVFMCLAFLGFGYTERRFEGSLNVEEPITLTAVEEIGSGRDRSRTRKTVTLEAGEYDVVLEAKSKTKMEFKVGGNRFPISIPGGMVMPDANGSFEIRSGDSGLAYDLRGDVNTAVEDGSEKEGTESCNYSDWAWTCDGWPHRPAGDYCRWDVVDNWGRPLRPLLRQDGDQKLCFFPCPSRWGGRGRRFHGGGQDDFAEGVSRTVPLPLK